MFVSALISATLVWKITIFKEQMMSKLRIFIVLDIFQDYSAVCGVIMVGKIKFKL